MPCPQQQFDLAAVGGVDGIDPETTALLRAVESLVDTSLRDWHARFRAEIQFQNEHLVSKLAGIAAKPSSPFHSAMMRGSRASRVSRVSRVGSQASMRRKKTSRARGGEGVASVPLGFVAEGNFDEINESTDQEKVAPVKMKAKGPIRSRFSMSQSWSTIWVANQSFLQKLLTSKWFEYAVSICIFLNCATMGLQAHAQIVPMNASVMDFLEWSEHLFTAVFTMEFMLRLTVFGCMAFFPNNWDRRMNLADALMVFASILVNWVRPLVERFGKEVVQGDHLKLITVFRAFRMVRLLRVFRKVPMFREAWMLIRGLKDSFRTLLWTCVVIFLVTYGFAIFGLVTMVQQLHDAQVSVTDPSRLQTIEQIMPYMAGLDNLMFTLCQVLTQDSFHSVIRDILPFVPWSWIYFYTYTAVSCFVLMNLVTAIIVENAMSNSKSDHEHAIQELERKNEDNLRVLQALFEEADEDENGQLSWPEFRRSFSEPSMRNQWMLLDFHERDCEELFDLLDDGDGQIDIEEFFAGLQKFKGPAQSKDLFKAVKTICRVEKFIRDLCGNMDVMSMSTSDGSSQLLR